MTNRLELEEKTITIQAESERRKDELGVLGRFFGAGENVRLYIVGTIALGTPIVALLYSLIYPLLPSSSDFGLRELWTLVVLPVESTIIGYLIGSRSKDNNS